MAIKTIVLIFLILVVYVVFFKSHRKNFVNKNKEIEDIMTECVSCKTFVSKKDGIMSNGEYFCNKECYNDYFKR